MKNHFLITFSRVAELGGKVVYSVPPSREFRAQTVPGRCFKRKVKKVVKTSKVRQRLNSPTCIQITPTTAAYSHSKQTASAKKSLTAITCES